MDSFYNYYQERAGKACFLMVDGLPRIVTCIWKFICCYGKYTLIFELLKATKRGEFYTDFSLHSTGFSVKEKNVYSRNLLKVSLFVNTCAFTKLCLIRSYVVLNPWNQEFDTCTPHYSQYTDLFCLKYLYILCTDIVHRSQAMDEWNHKCTCAKL